MPYLGDAPSNPVPLVLSGGSATGEAAGAAEHDRHVCWFSLPAQAAGSSVRLDTIGGDACQLVMLWAGGNTAHFIAVDELDARQRPALRRLPDGVGVLIGVFPPGLVNAAGGRRNYRGVDVGSGYTALSAAGWDAEFPADLTRRLPAGVSLTATVLATTTPIGTPENPRVLDFTASPAAQTFDVGAWEYPNFALELVLPAGRGVEVRSSAGIPPSVVLEGAAVSEEYYGDAVLFTPPSLDPGATTPTLTAGVGGMLPTGVLSVRSIAFSDLSGTATGASGIAAEPSNVLLFRTEAATRAVEAPSGSFSMATVPEGDYIAVFFSQADGRDVRATNVLVPQGNRAAGGGYPFP